MGKGWVIFLLALAVLYAAYAGYIPEGQKYFKQIEARIKGSLPESLPKTNPKETTLKSFPVIVSYEVSDKKTKQFFKTTYSYYVLTLKFKNIGSESVIFIIDEPVVVSEGKTYKSGVQYEFFDFVDPTVKIFPDAVVTKSYKFTTLPKTGKLYIDIYTSRATSSESPKKIETVALSFERTGE